MVEGKQGRRLHRIEEFAGDGGGNLVLLHHIDQFIIGGHAVLFGKKHPRGLARLLQLGDFKIAKGPDDGIHFPFCQRRGQGKIDVDQLDVRQLQPGAFQHGGEQGLLKPGNGIADGAALEIGNGFYRPVGQHHKAVERGGNGRSDAHERQAFLDLLIQVGLVGQRNITLPGGHQTRRGGWVSWLDQRDLQPRSGEITALLGDNDGGMVGIGEPVEQHRQLVRRLSGQDGAGEAKGETGDKVFHTHV